MQVSSLKHIIQRNAMWLMVALYYFYEMVLRASSGVLAQEFMNTFQLQATQIGTLAAVYGYVYSGLQMPCGMLLDRIGVRYIVSISCVLCAFGALLLGAAYHYPIALLGRVCIGAGSACAFISTLRLIVEWFEPRHFTLMSSLTNAVGCIGGLCAAYPLAQLIALLGWRQALFVLSGAGLVLAALIWLCVRDRPETISNLSLDMDETGVGGTPSTLSELVFPVLKNKYIWVAGILGALLYSPLVVFAEAWGIPFLQNVYNLSASKASAASMYIYVSIALGSVLVLPLCRRWKSYLTPIAWSIPVISGALLAIALFSGWVWFPLILGLCVVIGLAMGAQVLVFSIVNDHVPSKLSGTASALTNSIIMGVCYILQSGFGRVMDYFWDHTRTLEGTPVYSSWPYRYALCILAVIIFFALLGIVILHRFSSSIAQKDVSEYSKKS